MFFASFEGDKLPPEIQGHLSNGLFNSPAEVMKYYLPPLTGTVNTSGLVSARNGQCGAWADFIVDVLKGQGTAILRKFQVRPPTYPGATPATTLFVYTRIKVGPAQGNPNPTVREFSDGHIISVIQDQWLGQFQGAMTP